MLIQDNLEIRKWSFLLNYYFTVATWKGYPLHPLKKLLKHQQIVFDSLFKSSHSLPVRLETCVPSWVMRIVGQSFYFTVKWLYSKLTDSHLGNRPSYFPGHHKLSLTLWKATILRTWASVLLTCLINRSTIAAYNILLREWYLTQCIEKPSFVP